MTNLCLNDSRNPEFCAAGQGIGSVGSFQSAVGIICGWVALRAETAMPAEWIAGRLQMGSRRDTSIICCIAAERRTKGGHNMRLSKTDAFLEYDKRSTA